MREPGALGLDEVHDVRPMETDGGAAGNRGAGMNANGKVALSTPATIEELSLQLKDQHGSLLRFLGYMRDRLPETTAWDLFAAAALHGLLVDGAAMKAVPFAAVLADQLLSERTKREQDALEARKADKK